MQYHHSMLGAREIYDSASRRNGKQNHEKEKWEWEAMGSRIVKRKNGVAGRILML
jgi:hypothetical protein